jgi:DNA transposition AAA+ family ATPase
MSSPAWEGSIPAAKFAPAGESCREVCYSQEAPSSCRSGDEHMVSRSLRSFVPHSTKGKPKPDATIISIQTGRIFHGL